MLAAFWILDPLYTALGYVLSWFYQVIPDYGIAIVLLTVAVRLVTFPLTAKQAKAQQQLQKIQPELKRLQQKYKSDKQKLNEEMMKFYKENNVNPFGSCLPLLLQMPVLIVLYRLIIGLTGSAIIGFTILPNPLPAPSGASVRVTAETKITGGKLVKGTVTSGTLVGADLSAPGQTAPAGTLDDVAVKDGKIASVQVVNGKAQVTRLADLTVQTGKATKVVGTPKHVPKDSDLYSALRKSGGQMDSFGMDLAKSASTAKGADIVPYLILVAGVMLSGYYQQRQLTARQPKNSTPNQMQTIGKVMPVVFGVISFSIPAGVVVYFLVSNLWQVGQQAFIFRNQPVEAGAGGKGGGKGAAKPGRGAAAKAETASDAKNEGGRRKGAKPAAGSGRDGGANDGRRQQGRSTPARTSKQRAQNRSKGRRPPPPKGTRPKGSGRDGS